jgi:transposase-like protein
MSRDRRTEIVRHLSEEKLNRLLDEAGGPKTTKRLTFVKRLYKEANIEDAADDAGKSASTGSRWARRWNEGGLGEEQQEQLREMLRNDQPLESPGNLAVAR